MNALRRLSAIIRSAPGVRRRGVVILLALGVLGIIAISALAYVTIVRQDRTSAIAATTRANFQGQVQVVVNEIGTNIAAALFGGKVVTNATPQVINDVPVWPSIFEDGGWRDVPLTDLRTPNWRSPGAEPNRSARLELDQTRQRFEVGYPDRPWMASPEPLWSPVGATQPTQTRRWLNLSNLRLTWRFDDNGTPTNPGDDRWIRGDGRFVDIGQWFLQASNGFANPDIDLHDQSWLPTDQQLGPDKGVDQDVFDLPMNLMARFTPPNQTAPGPGSPDLFTPRDERQWVDTDGDLRPDARWQQLDALGSVFGYRWFVATRIIDASAFVNVNSSIEFASEDTARAGTGVTPADVDLKRLLADARTTNWAAPLNPTREIRINRVPDAFTAHLRALNLTDIALGARTLAQQPPGERLPVWGRFLGIEPVPVAPAPVLTTRLQREAYWMLFGANPASAVLTAGLSVPDRDLTDLLSFAGTNDAAIVSTLELRFDGPDDSGYLPTADGSTVFDLGPLRSRELVQEARRFDFEDPTRTLPTLRQIRDSTRRFLTTVSGIGRLSPVPVLSTQSDDIRFAGVTSRERVRLADGAMANRPAIGGVGRTESEEVRRTFESLVWALAPLATNQPLSRELADAGPSVGYSNRRPEVHYGGGNDGPARRVSFGSPSVPVSGLFPGSPDPDSGDALSNVFQIPGTLPRQGSDGSDFAILTAAMLTANIRDAIDEVDGSDPLEGRQQPTLLFLVDDLDRGAADKIGELDFLNGGAFTLGTSFAHGIVDTLSTDFPRLPETIPASEPNAIQRSIAVAGVERHPFLVEATTIAIYSNSDQDGPAAPSEDGTIKPADEAGSAIIVQIANPWGGRVAITEHWRIILAWPDGAIAPDFAPPPPFTVDPTFNDKRIILRPSGLITLEAGDLVTLYWISSDPSNSRWQDSIRPELERAILDDSARAEPVELVSLPASGSDRVPFREFPRGSVVVLTQDVALEAGTDPSERIVIDRLTPDRDLGAERFPLTLLNADTAGTGFDSGEFTFATGRAENAMAFDGNYFAGLGYEVDRMEDSRFAGNEPVPEDIRGRLALVSSVSRPATKSDGGGFPTYVLELPEKNQVSEGVWGHAWMVPPRDFPTPPIVVPTTSEMSPADIVFPGVGIDFDQAWQIDDPGKADNARWPNSASIPPFQLYVPSAEFQVPRLNAASELLMVPCYAHTCSRWGRPEGNSGAPTPTTHEPISDTRYSLLRWSTFSEKLGQSVDYTYTNPGTPASPNPYLGVLDPTRFMLTESDVFNLPDTLALPLALRVPDCFEVLAFNGPLAQGRININTAPEQVLKMLPFVAPWQNIEGELGAVLPADQDGLNRIPLIRRYRTPVPQSGGPVIDEELPEVLTGLNGLRRQAESPTVTEAGTTFAPPRATGFVFPTELAILDRWDVGATPVSGATGFLELGQPDAAAISGVPLELVTDYAGADFNPRNDPEERLAIFRAVSNIVTTRSDVFIAWFVIRAYDPQAVETIPVPDGAGPQQRLAVMDDPDVNFGPVYESRWLAVFDRSQVRRPTDRPRVLMLVELPPRAAQ